MTRDELMKQSAEALIRWINSDRTLPVEWSTSGTHWETLNNPGWRVVTDYYRIAEPPKVKRVPLGPEDFPPGPDQHCVNPPNSLMPDEYMTVVLVTRTYIRPSGWGNIAYVQLMNDNWLRWIDGKWQPCWKEVPDDSTSQQH